MVSKSSYFLGVNITKKCVDLYIINKSDKLLLCLTTKDYKLPMQTITTRNIPKGTNYLSDVMPELPSNCLFDKGLTGCGGTTIALTNNKPTVVCVPYVPLVENKALQSNQNTSLYPYEVFPVHGKVTTKKLSEYLSRAAVPKIIVTYDSLTKVMEKIDPSEYNLLVDEYHTLFTNYTLRKKAVLIVLNNYKQFKSFTFMTATPVGNDFSQEFTLEELKDVDVVKAVWEDSLQVTVTPVKNKNGVKKTIAHKITEILAGKCDGNYYFFVNSVKFINQMISHGKLTNANCRVIYSEYNDTPCSIKRGRATDEPKKINFITSCGFEGLDFYDENGKIIIVSDPYNPYTLVDISTQFLQICGRIRDSKYKEKVYHVYNNTRYSGDLSFSEFEKMMKIDIEDEQSDVEDLYNMKNKKLIIKCAKNLRLQFFQIDEEEQTIKRDYNAPKIDLYNYRLLNSDYKTKTRLNKQYKKNNILVQHWVLDSANPELLPMDDVTNFESTVKELKILSEQSTSSIGAYKFKLFFTAACKQHDCMSDALELLGFEGIERLKYRVTDIRRKIVTLLPKISEESDLLAISKMLHLNKSFSLGSIQTGQFVKDCLNQCYKDLGIKKNATASDIYTYYNVKDKTKTVEGRQQRALAIMSPKFKHN